MEELRPWSFFPSFVIALGSCTTQLSPCVNPSVNPIEQDELAGAPKRSNTCSNKAFTPLEAPIPPLVLPSAKYLFTKLIKMFMVTLQVQAEPWERPLKAKTPEIYWSKSHIECHHFCQQCEDYFKTSGTIRMNCTAFVALFFRSSMNIRCAQYKHRYKSATPITWSIFKAFFQKDLGSSQTFIDSIWSKFRRNS